MNTSGKCAVDWKMSLVHWVISQEDCVMFSILEGYHDSCVCVSGGGGGGGDVMSILMDFQYIRVFSINEIAFINEPPPSPDLIMIFPRGNEHLQMY